MNILAVDTSTSYTHLALSSNALYEERLISFLQSSENLLPEIRNMLERAKLEIKDLDLLVCTRGPGSFTSLRIAMSTLKGFSLACGLPLVSLPTLKCMALASGYKGQTLAAIDAKKKRYYLGLYEEGEEICPNLDGGVEDLLPYIKRDVPLFVTGVDAVAFSEKLKEADPALNIILDLTPLRNLGRVMIAEGIKAYEKDGADDIGQGPVYIRRSDAEEALIKKLNGEV